MTTLTQTTEIVNFRNQPLITLKVGEIIYTAIRPIVEGMGLEWSTQLQKLKRNMAKFNCVHMNTVAEDGKIREMLCIPIKKLNGWLFSINPEKIKDIKVKQDVIDYQEECFEVLHDYWHKGVAVNPRRITISVTQQKEIRFAVARRANGHKPYFQTVYTALYSRFNIPRYTELLANDFETAIKFIEAVDLTSSTEILDNETAQLVEAVLRQNTEMQDVWDGLRYMNREKFSRWSNLIVKTNVLAERLSNKLSSRYATPKVDERNKCIVFNDKETKRINLNWFNCPA